MHVWYVLSQFSTKGRHYLGMLNGLNRSASYSRVMMIADCASDSGPARFGMMISGFGGMRISMEEGREMVLELEELDEMDGNS